MKLYSWKLFMSKPWKFYTKEQQVVSNNGEFIFESNIIELYFMKKKADENVNIIISPIILV